MKTGSILSGTDRIQDLVPAFLDTLREVDPAYTTALSSMNHGEGPIPDDAKDDDSHCWWSCAGAVDLMDNLQFALEARAPAGHYFGEHPDDDTNIGFWPEA